MIILSEIEQIPIGRFSLFTQLTQKALRLYDKKGIMIPGSKDPITGYRYYKVSQIERGIKIKILSKLGFGLSDISLILKAPEQENGKKITNYGNSLLRCWFGQKGPGQQTG